MPLQILLLVIFALLAVNAAYESVVNRKETVRESIAWLCAFMWCLISLHK